ncbi:hypothetical protein F5J12DRAFT_178268 [Pisolithus orientalis]|uniref:uncharacterized protein n=1 Tax=Pisolithus orientalis TaxID=936130 RepID=UPI0022255654|nr:uncharacterized protein F5J12DRAFT_178268 [Pisolithus orientalis]KAI6032611.1 hypothetical protein F5J12DRAFT_178268 [Pisolithus orientalis]
MNVDPLADTAPSRHAIESDDEDEYDSPSLSKPKPDQLSTPDIKFAGNFPIKSPLLLASGIAGGAWARGADLGQQQGAIYVGDSQVGLLFLPSWTRAAVVVSETFTRLPLSAMNPYTAAVVDRIQPTSISVLDSYSVQGYISSRIIPWDEAPVRYLSTNAISISDPELELFAPPNLMQSTMASLVSNVFWKSLASRENFTVALFLLPSPKLPVVPPSTIKPSSFPPPSDDIQWGKKTMQKVHQWLFETIGEGRHVAQWVERNRGSSELQAENRRRAQGEIGEGGMYI